MERRAPHSPWSKLRDKEREAVRVGRLAASRLDDAVAQVRHGRHGHGSGHDRLFDSFILEEANHLSQLANADPFNPVRQTFNDGIGFFVDGRD